jgi:ATP phosphoribosyltransferase
VRLQVGGSGVLVQPMTYIFDEEPLRWRQLLETLGIKNGNARQNGAAATADRA